MWPFKCKGDNIFDQIIFFFGQFEEFAGFLLASLFIFSSIREKCELFGKGRARGNFLIPEGGWLSIVGKNEGI